MSYPECFLILDLQNDLCHPEGVYAKHGLTPTHVPKIVPNIVKMVTFCKENAIPTISLLLTVITDTKGHATGLGGVRKLRPFLEREGFRENTWGHDLLEEIPKVHYQVRQWGMSPFFQTELDHYLLALGCQNLILSGFTTNGVVETCAREATGRYLKIITLTDCVTSYSDSLHQS